MISRCLSALLVCLLVESSALAESLCRQALVGKTSYWNQVVETKGLRLFIKTSSEASSEKKWGGLIRHRPMEELNSGWRLNKYLRYSIRTLPLELLGIKNAKDYELTLLKGMYEQTVQRASNWASKRLFDKRLEPAFFLRVPISILLGMTIWSHADNYYQNRLQDNINQNISAHSATYMDFISSDFRYRQIKMDLSSGKISQQEATSRAFWEEFAYSEYYKYRENKNLGVQDLNSEMKLIDHFAFHHLKKVMTEGVQPMEGYDVPEAAIGQLKSDQKLQLFSINHVLNLRYQLIVERVKNSEVYQKIKDDPDVAKVLSPIFSSRVGQALETLRNTGQISQAQQIYSLQEYAYWQGRFAEWSAIGVTKLKKENGHYTDMALRLEDIESEIISDLDQKK